MKIPSEDQEREQFYQQVTDDCFASVQRRKTDYDLMKSYFMHGGPPEEPATPYNKIYPHIDTLTAFLFSADSTRFGCHLPVSVHDDEWAKVPQANKAINEEWIDSNGDMVFGQALTWAMVKNTAIIKVIVRDGKPCPYIIEPECFGVYREDLNYLDRQEAMAHRYYITRSQLDADLESHPNREKIIASLGTKPMRAADSMPDSLRRIIVTNSSGTPPISPGGTIRGNGMYNNDSRIDYTAQVSADVVEMVELWVWDDAIADYRVVTRADGNITIYDRQNLFLPAMMNADESEIDQRGEHPFVQICPNPMNGYFWGTSEVSRLVGLQQFRNERIGQIRDLLAKQVNPPVVLFGMFGAVDELDFALNKAGGVLPSQDPMAKVERHKPDIPTDIWQEIHMIDEMFSEASGLQNILMGKGESGVRSGRQTSELARMGSSRIKKRALIVEDSLSSLATKYFKVLRKYGKDRLKMDDKAKTTFILAQMPNDTHVMVDAHSNSPLFSEDQKNLAAQLFEAHAIDRSTLIKMVSPPMMEVMLRDLKKIEANEAAQAKAKAQAEQAGAKKN
jgi:hypothetical protein